MSDGDGDGRVSVIVPVFNVAAYLSDCVNSALNQSYANVEVILIDDGSTDGSGALCDSFADRDLRVRVIHQANAGLSAARNVGLALSTGHLVTFLDGDDWWDRRFVATLVQALRNRPSADLAMSSFARVPGRTWTPHVDQTALLSDTEVVNLFAGPQHTLFTMACAKLYRRRALQGVTFPVGRVHEDEFTTYRVLMRGSTVLVPESLYLYRQRDDGITASVMTPERLLDAIAAADQQADDFLAAGYFRAAAWAQDQAFRKRLRLVVLLKAKKDQDRAAAHTEQLARAARVGRGLPRATTVRAARWLAATWPRQSVQAFAILGTKRERISRPWNA